MTRLLGTDFSRGEILKIWNVVSQVLVAMVVLDAPAEGAQVGSAHWNTGVPGFPGSVAGDPDGDRPGRFEQASPVHSSQLPMTSAVRADQFLV